MNKFYLILTLNLLLLAGSATKSQTVVFSSNFDDIGNRLVNKDYQDSSLTSGGWTTQDVQGAEAWYIDGYSGDNYAFMSGYDGSPQANEDWLISPAFDGTGLSSVTLNFENGTNFNGPAMEVLISSDYDGTSLPSTATWDTLSYTQSPGSWTWVSSGDVDLTPYVDTSTYVAFLYTSTTSGSAAWEIDDISITGPINNWFGSRTNIEADSLNALTTGVQYGTYAAQIINEQTSHRRLTTKAMSVSNGQTFDIKFWAKGFGGIRTGLYDNDQSDGDYGYTYGNWINLNSSSWTMKTQTITADTSFNAAEFILSVNSTGAASGHVQVDSLVIIETSGSSIEENNRSIGLNLYPNPTREKLNVRLDNANGDTELRLMNDQGALVRSKTINGPQTVLNTGELASGLYFLQVRNGTQLAIEKISVE